MNFAHLFVKLRPKLKFINLDEKYIVNLHLNSRGKLIEILNTHNFTDASASLCLDTHVSDYEDLEKAKKIFFTKALLVIRSKLSFDEYRNNTDVSITFVFHKVIP